ncbi:MAG: nuclear transport factor 2 family protein [Rhodothermaceae bacterium]|nr:nuclear transport factor 2 family protein [Rhodothermaceae bacterium]MXZ57124.1 nuclear transport factor 2 family protein [Rhodothermaceae bacterium]MYB90822.1 nuclear transport factor 2 family protein [Rhodothermaceae bacterium]MYD68808.1 nuclear transport factor 2 family protein [Rhodothermaceae bacterium]MYG44991.1 nuclear transport factor 2 family protein [Rhodothermaceae bacterium]
MNLYCPTQHHVSNQKTVSPPGIVALLVVSRPCAWVAPGWQNIVLRVRLYLVVVQVNQSEREEDCPALDPGPFPAQSRDPDGREVLGGNQPGAALRCLCPRLRYPPTGYLENDLPGQRHAPKASKPAALLRSIPPVGVLQKVVCSGAFILLTSLYLSRNNVVRASCARISKCRYAGPFFVGWRDIIIIHCNARGVAMFRSILFLGTILLTGLVIGCSATQESDIQNLLQMQQDAWNAGDIETFMQGYLNSDSLRFVGSGGEVRGWQSTLDRYHRAYPDREAMGTLSFDLREIRMLGRRHAMIFGAYTLERDNDQPTGLFTLIAEYTEDGWRIIHDHTSADPIDYQNLE